MAQLSIHVIVLLAILSNHSSTLGQWCYITESCGPRSDQWNAGTNCKTGANQSPINIFPDNVTKVKGAKTLLFSTAFNNLNSFQIFNTGNFVALRELSQDPVESTIQLKGYGFPSVYGFFAVRFHWGSEHLIKSIRYALEMQIIFKTRNSIATPAYVVVTFVAGKENKALTPVVNLLSQINQPGSQTDMPDGFNISAMLPKVWHIFRYNGSATTPPCEAGTLWSIFTTRITASQAQIDAFHKIQLTGGAKNNNRPIQATYTKQRKHIYYLTIDRVKSLRGTFTMA